MASCRMEIESSCGDRQGQGFCCRIYFVAYQNKRFNFSRLASKNWKTTNLEILKFEARFALKRSNFGRISAIEFSQFFPDDSLS